MNPEAPSFFAPECQKYAEGSFTPIDGSVAQLKSDMVSMQALFNGTHHEHNGSTEHCDDMEDSVQIMRRDFEFMRAQQRGASEENTLLLQMNVMLKQQLNAEMQAAAAHIDVLTKQREEALEIGALLQKAVVDLSIIHMEKCANVIGGCAHLDDSGSNRFLIHLRYCCHFTHFTPFWITMADIVQRSLATRATPWISLQYMSEKARENIDLTRQWQRLIEADAYPQASNSSDTPQSTTNTCFRR